MNTDTYSLLSRPYSNIAQSAYHANEAADRQHYTYRSSSSFTLAPKRTPYKIFLCQ